MYEQLISIIIPIYKAEQYVSKCINSVLAQTYSRWELLLVNDGSPDRCNEICQKYAEKDERIRYFEQQNQGVSVARNLGIENAKGDILIFVDADDWINKEMCQTIVEHWDESIELLLFDYQEVHKNGKHVHRHFFQQEYINFQSDLRYDIDYLMLSVLGFYQDWDKKSVHTIAVPWSRAYSQKFICNNNIYFPVGIYMNEDRIFNLRCIDKIKNAIYINSPLYNYCTNDNSVTNTMNKKDAFQLIDNYNKVFKILKEIIKSKKDKRYREAYARYIIVTIGEIIWYKPIEKEPLKRKKCHDFYKSSIKNIYHKDVKNLVLKEKIEYFCFFLNMFWIIELYAWISQSLKRMKRNHK